MPHDRDDDLYSPTLAGYSARAVGAPRPWRLGSQFYVAFFGGPIAAAAVGYLNGKRLGLPRERLLAIVGLGAAGVVAALVAIVVTDAEGRVPRLVSQVVGVLVYLGSRQLQSAADRLYRAREPDEDNAFASLWGPGLLIVLLGGLATALVFIPVIVS